MSAAIVLVVVVLGLWLFERTPPFVPTLLLVAGAPILLAGTGFGIDDAVAAGAHPVLALFFGGFVLAAAAGHHGLDRAVVTAIVGVARGRRRGVVAGLALAAAVLSMWISNVAAAALLVQVARPLVAGDGGPVDERFRRAALLAVAFGANFGGIATPIGTGPNAIALAAVAGSGAAAPSFAGWMAFGLPLTALLLAIVIVIVIVRYGVAGDVDLVVEPVVIDRGGRAVIVVFAVCIFGWLTAPLHGVDPAVVALLAAAALFGFRLLPRSALAQLDWSTLLLIAGGLVLGEVLSVLGLLRWFHEAAAGVPAEAVVVVLVLGAALLSSVMSNTATATLLVPLGLTLVPQPSTAVLIAVACSLGAPFAISTPQNALVAGAGVKGSDLLVVGLPLLLIGVVVVAVSGPTVLTWFGLGTP